MLTVIFRANVGTITGTGHLAETCTLLRALRRRGGCCAVLVVNRHPEFVAPLERAGFNRIVWLSPGEETPDAEEQHVLSVLRAEYPDAVLVTDLFNYDDAAYALLAGLFPRSVVVLDTQHPAWPAGGCVVNFSVVQNVADYRDRNDAARFHLGPEYMIMDEQILRWMPADPAATVRRVFINQGGSDPYALTAKTLDLLATTGCADGLECEVVTGGAVRGDVLAGIQERERMAPAGMHFHYALAPATVYELMAGCQMALTAAGNTLYELAYLGVPSVVLSHHERHDRVAKAFAERGAVHDLGIGAGVTADAFAGAVTRLRGDSGRRVALAAAARRLVDGRGTERVCALIAEQGTER